ncbi:hypothetical protein AKJ41_04905 [candidate division MSBL1 archaeon SCGC-AAA259O05]|uniref:Helicase C-terminal domain-containing protein n=1 Tax=candidate division MSBL1 archaeon SCGC-AAA259O05 TaxID=1698271 RepID=A0A133V013_9EURY|nr:hypothetical protein AKJ41_04905 [candidate division MSBL1 archaeon SCGC-AAA259O05]
MRNLEDEDTRASSLFLNHDETKKLRKLMKGVEGSHNPKLEKVVEILQRHFCGRPRGRAMVFAEYRDTVDFLTEKLNEYPNMAVGKFIGQAGSEGMTQKEQKKTLERFERAEFDVLVSTSIGEEGIDVPSTSLVVFYEPVPQPLEEYRGREEPRGTAGRARSRCW